VTSAAEKPRPQTPTATHSHHLAGWSPPETSRRYGQKRRLLKSVVPAKSTDRVCADKLTHLYVPKYIFDPE
jgi:hypothetical protein